MKKILILLIAPVFGFGQVLTDVKYLSGWNIYPEFQDTTVLDIHPQQFKTPDGIILAQDTYDERVVKYVVPQGKFWKIVSASTAETHHLGNFIYTNEKVFTNTEYISLYIYSNNMGFYPLDLNKDTEKYPGTHYNMLSYKVSNGAYLKGGVEFAVTGAGGPYQLDAPYQVIIYEYTLNDSSLSYNKPEAIYNNSNTPVLFPNPTSSLLALNSDKEYEIEVYDMLGNKLMALTGNAINMEHLSTATYIVKATDKSNNEELTYKVVKN